MLQRRVSRKKKGSKNRHKSIKNLANQRNDFLQKLSSRVVSENQGIAVESLNVSGMQKNHCLAQSISDVSWGSFFTMLECKCERYGKTLLKIGKFEPSSKLCSHCGYINRDRFQTENGSAPIAVPNRDRDINAAANSELPRPRGTGWFTHVPMRGFARLNPFSLEILAYAPKTTHMIP